MDIQWYGCKLVVGEELGKGVRYLDGYESRVANVGFMGSCEVYVCICRSGEKSSDQDLLVVGSSGR